MSGSGSDGGVVVVFGASGGIGRQVCRRLNEQGHTLVMAARHIDPLKELAAEIGNATPIECDARDFDQVAGVFKQAGEIGNVVGAANLVGSILLKPAHATSRDEFDETVGQNLVSAFAVVRAGAKAMRQGGSIVLMGSSAGEIGITNHEAIAAAKAGVSGLARSAAATYAPSVRVNCVAPGLVDTPLASGLTGSEAALEASKAMHPLGRIGQPADIAPAIAWLLGPESSWVTGQTISVDGGMASVKPKVKVSAKAK